MGNMGRGMMAWMFLFSFCTTRQYLVRPGSWEDPKAGSPDTQDMGWELQLHWEKSHEARLL
jgi:hypothetical protein